MEMNKKAVSLARGVSIASFPFILIRLKLFIADPNIYDVYEQYGLWRSTFEKYNIY